MRELNILLRWRLKHLLKTLSDKSAEGLHALGLFPLLTETLKRLVWAPEEIREELQKNGVNVIPANYYSNIPSIDEVRNSFEYATKEPPYLDCGIFNDTLMLSVLAELMPYVAEFNPPKEGNEEDPSGFFWDNSQFSHSDAMSCYALLRHLKPRRVIEIGSGFSTLVTSVAIANNGQGEIICIEPYPRQFLGKVAGVTQLIQKPVQQIPLDFFNDTLSNGDVIFIDSTHTVKTGSDCLYLYLKVLPALRHRCMIHVHDVFLPDAMPKEWALSKQIYWTEQYLLLAYLLDNPRVRCWFGSHYHLRLHQELLAKFMHGQANAGGGSFWFELAPPGEKSAGSYSS